MAAIQLRPAPRGGRTTSAMSGPAARPATVATSRTPPPKMPPRVPFAVGRRPAAAAADSKCARARCATPRKRLRMAARPSPGQPKRAHPPLARPRQKMPPRGGRRQHWPPPPGPFARHPWRHRSFEGVRPTRHGVPPALRPHFPRRLRKGPWRRAAPQQRLPLPLALALVHAMARRRVQGKRRRRGRESSRPTSASKSSARHAPHCAW
mmetsp:Transcript_53203/g.171611  ORF Transcript_53203/g.171611 Transcript_53203/m.171611 type:complete len:208 (+) Transcript_53203:327-950(+)